MFEYLYLSGILLSCLSLFVFIFKRKKAFQVFGIQKSYGYTLALFCIALAIFAFTEIVELVNQIFPILKLPEFELEPAVGFFIILGQAVVTTILLRRR